MSRLSDSRDPLGIGILILQHKEYDNRGYSLDLRGSLLAVRVLDRDDNAGGLGSWKYDDKSAGDINGGFLWPKNTRVIPGWAFAWPAILIGGSNGTPTPSGGGGGGGGGGGMPPVETPDGGLPQFPPVETPSNQGRRPGGNIANNPPRPPQEPPVPPPRPGEPPPRMTNDTNKNCSLMTSVNMLPVGDIRMLQDSRYAQIPPQFPRWGNNRSKWNKLPRGHYGIGLTATNENQQIEYFLSGDPRLISINFAGDASCGTLVCDLTDESEYDQDRTARLQSHLWVIRGPDGCIDFYRGNALAWNISPAGCKDTRGGMVIDRPSGDGVGAVINANDRSIGMASFFETGPFDTGSMEDLHGIGQDADGHPINSLHISTHTLFRRSFVEDAPLSFEVWREPQGAPFSVPVHLGLDGDQEHNFVCGTRPGLWRWWAESWIYEPKVPPKEVKPPVEQKAPVVEPQKPPVKIPPGVKAPPNVKPPPELPKPGTPPFVHSTQATPEIRTFAAMLNELAVPALLGRPTYIGSRAYDLRNANPIDDAIREAVDKSSPVTYRLEAFGKQQANGEWAYNQRPGYAKYPGGVGQGGFVLLPPEIGMEDAPNFAPDGVTVSNPSFIVHPSATFAAGLPDLTTGAVKTGYKWGADTAGNLLFTKVTSAGVGTVVSKFTDGGVSNWKEVAGAPTTPVANDWGIYFKSTGLFVIDDAGVETGPLGTGGSSPHPLLDGVIANDTIANSPAKGSIIVGDDTKTSFWDVLVVGTDGHVLTADSSEALGVKWAPPGGASALTVEAHTSDDVLTSGETGSWHTNEGAGGNVTLTLPPAAAGLNYTFVVKTAAVLKIVPDAGDNVQIGSTSGTVSCSASTVGNVIMFMAVNATDWVGSYGTGVWSIV